MKILFTKGNRDYILMDCGHSKFRYRYSSHSNPRCKECYELNLNSLANKLGFILLPGKNVLKHYQVRDFICISCNNIKERYTSTVYNGTAKCRCKKQLTLHN